MNDPKPSLTEPALTRRSFLKNASTAVAGGALLGALPIERFALGASPGDTIRIALVGAGGRGRGAAAQALRTNGDVKLVAVADAFKNSLEGGLKQIQSEFKDRPERLAVTEDTKFVGLDAYKKAIELADVVVIATPPGFRPIHFEEAVRASTCSWKSRWRWMVPVFVACSLPRRKPRSAI
jgi:myo-inositol 2-dehydrogenase/D-chiro-inositol 1-dehydrogenase